MKVHIVRCRMFIRIKIDNRLAPCTGCAGFNNSLCYELPRCTIGKASVFKEVIYKEKQDA